MGGMRVTAVLCGLGAIAIMGSCASGLNQGMAPKYLQCQQQTDTSVSATMRAGSELRLMVPPGHVLVIPAGGAPVGTVFTLRSLPVPMARVSLEPSGPIHPSNPLPGAPSAMLTLSYQHCSQPGNPEMYGIWRLPNRPAPGTAPVRVGGNKLPGEERVSVSLDSLSTYSLAAN
jgi:hypothetical protein